MASLLDAPALVDQWYVVAESADVGSDNDPRPVTVLGRSYAMWRDAAGSVVAVADRCPHREMPLSNGSVVGGCLTCPYHGWTFGDEGACVEVPSSGPGRAVPPAAHLRTFPIVERYGLIWMSPGSPDHDVCRIDVESAPGYRRVNSGIETWAVSCTRMVDNFLDVSHFPYVHVGTFGTEQERVVPPIGIVDLDECFVGFRYAVEVRDEHGDRVDRQMTTGFHLPFTVRSTILTTTVTAGTNERSEAVDHQLLLCSTPVGAATSLFTFVVWHNDADRPGGPPPPEELIAFDRAIGAEDKVMLERIAGELPLDQRATVSVQADRASVEWRRRLATLVGRAPSDGV